MIAVNTSISANKKEVLTSGQDVIRVPYKQRVGGSNPSTPTNNQAITV